MLDPITLAIARSDSPLIWLKSVTKSSGADVPTPIIKKDISIIGKPAIRDKNLMPWVKKYPPLTSNKSANKK